MSTSAQAVHTTRQSLSPTTLASDIANAAMPHPKQLNLDDPDMMRTFAETIAKGIAKALRDPPLPASAPEIPFELKAPANTYSSSAWEAPMLPTRPSYLSDTVRTQDARLPNRKHLAVSRSPYKRRHSSLSNTRFDDVRDANNNRESLWADVSDSDCEVQTKKLPRWTQDETRTITKLRRQGYSFEDITRHVPGRSCTGVTQKLLQLGVTAHGVKDSPQKKDFTSSEMRAIYSLKRAGLSWEEISSQMPGREARSVKKAYTRFQRAKQPDAGEVHINLTPRKSISNAPRTSRRPISREHNRWSSAELSSLKDIVVTKSLPYSAAIELFPHRSLNSVKCRSSRLVQQALRRMSSGSSRIASSPLPTTSEIVGAQDPIPQTPLDNFLDGSEVRARPHQESLPRDLPNKEQDPILANGGRPAHWSKVDLARLLDMVDVQKLDWTTISNAFPKKRLKNIKRKYQMLSKEPGEQYTDNSEVFIDEQPATICLVPRTRPNDSDGQEIMLDLKRRRLASTARSHDTVSHDRKCTPKKARKTKTHRQHDNDALAKQNVAKHLQSTSSAFADTHRRKSRRQTEGSAPKSPRVLQTKRSVPGALSAKERRKSSSDIPKRSKIIDDESEDELA